MSRELDRHTIEVQDKVVNEQRDEIERLREENERLREIVSEVENLHYGTDLFTSCAAGEADRLIELTESEVGDE